MTGPKSHSWQARNQLIWVINWYVSSLLWHFGAGFPQGPFGTLAKCFKCFLIRVSEKKDTIYCFCLTTPHSTLAPLLKQADVPPLTGKMKKKPALLLFWGPLNQSFTWSLLKNLLTVAGCFVFSQLSLIRSRSSSADTFAQYSEISDLPGPLKTFRRRSPRPHVKSESWECEQRDKAVLQ